MKFLRSVDRLSSSLAESQGRIFQKSVSEKTPSKRFIKSYMLSRESQLIDNLYIDIAGLSEGEIFETVNSKIETKTGEIYPYHIMYFIGYFYRMAAYLTGLSSKQLYQNIKPDLLYRNFDVIHSLPIEEEIRNVFEIANIEIEDKYFIFKKIHTMDL